MLIFDHVCLIVDNNFLGKVQPKKLLSQLKLHAKIKSEQSV